MSVTSSESTQHNSLLDVIDNGPVGVRQILLIAVCLLVNMLDGFDITAMAMVANSAMGELQIDVRQMGWIFGSTLIGMMGGAMVLAPLSDLIGRRSLIIASILLVGVSILLTANSTTLVEFLVLRFISGLGAGAVLACQASLAAEYSPERYRALAVAVATSGYPLGAMMTSVGAAFIMPEFGWRGMFWFGGALTSVMAIVVWLFVPESLKYLIERRPVGALQKVNRILSSMKRAPLPALPDSPSADSAATKDSMGKNVAMLLEKEHRRATLMLWVTFFLCFATMYFMLSWIPKLVDDAGHGFDAGRDAFFMFNFGGVAGIYVLGWLSTRWRLATLISTMLVGSAVCMLLFALVPAKLPLLLALILLIGILQQGGFAGLYSAAAKVYPTAFRSTGIGWSIGIGRIGAVVGPAAAGYLIAAGLGLSGNFIVFALPMAIGGLIAHHMQVS